MNYSAGVSFQERLTRLERDIQDGFGPQLLRGYRLPQTAPLDVFHRDVGVLIGLANLVDGYYVRMIERTRRASLAQEPPLPAQSLGVFGHQLDRDGPQESKVLGFVDLAH